MDWQEKQVITTINTTAYPVEHVEFPAITICSQGSAKDLTDVAIYRQFQTFVESKGKPTSVAESTDGKRHKRESNAELKEVFVSNHHLKVKLDMIYNGFYEIYVKIW